jgi:TetR/AcrR family hemagglutinin/protease transcriptional regulator
MLLERAVDVCARRGLGRTGHTEIAAESGVAVSTVFFYFPTRAELIDAVLGEVERLYLGMAERIHAQEKPARAVLVEHGRAFLASLETHPHHARVWLDWSTAFRDRLWPRYLGLVEKLVAAYERTIRRGQTEGSISPRLGAEESARLLIGSAQMLAQMKMTDFADEKLRAVARTIVTATLGEETRASQEGRSATASPNYEGSGRGGTERPGRSVAAPPAGTGSR